MNLAIQREFGDHYVLRADYLHNYGTHFIIGRTIAARVMAMNTNTKQE